jgi:hypothetical protein
MSAPLAPVTAHINRFRGAYHPHPTDCWTLDEALQAIRTGRWQDQMRTLRRTLTHGGKGLYDQQKKTLDAFSFGGTFAPTRSKEHLTQHSGLGHYDYDHLGALDHAREVLCAVPAVVYVFASPSGLGLKVGLRIPVLPSDRAYKHAWQCGADYLEAQTGLVADPSGKDICRLCFVSYDPEISLNLEAEVFPVPKVPAPLPSRRGARSASPGARSGSTRDRREQYVQQAIARARRLITESVPPTSTTQGNRHFNRLKASRLLGGYVGGGFLSYSAAYALLEGLVQHHTAHVARSMRTIADGLRDGMRTPVHYEDLEGERLAWCAAHGYATTPREGN